MNLKLKLKHKAMAPKLNPVPLSSFQAEKMNKKVKRKIKTIWKNYSLMINDLLMKKDFLQAD